MKSSKIIYSYAVKITDEPIEYNGSVYEQTARIAFRDNTKNLLEKRKMPVVDLKKVYESINTGTSLDLSGCFVSGFSLEDYRKVYSKSSDEVVMLNNFNAAGALFESDKVVEFGHAVFKGAEANFSGAHFGAGNLSFYKAKFECSKVDFSNTSYSEGHNIFQFVHFGGGDVDFENATFINGNISFVNVNFGDGNANFKNVSFGDGSVSFQFAEFGKGNVIFDKASFNGLSVDFSRVNFGQGKLDFRRCDFGNAEVSFEEMEHQNEKIIFRRARFGNKPVYFSKILAPGSEIILDEATFGTGKITFLDSQFKSISIKSCILSNYVDLRVQRTEVVDMSNAIVQNIVDFNKGLTHVKIEYLYIYGVRNLGKLFISWPNNNVRQLIGDQPKTSFNQKAEQYRLLKEDFHNSGQYEDEDQAYIEFKRNELLAMVHENSRKGWFHKMKSYLSYGLQKLVFDFMGLYATSPARVLISIFIVYGFYSLTYVLFELTNHGQISCIDPSMPVWEKLLDSFYFSAVTFLTIGYGECVPTGFFKIIAPLEGWTGVFMMSYFTVAFVRKILR